MCLMDIGKRICEIRTAKGLTRYRLTQITGISGHHIKGIEEGTRQPTIDTLQKLLVPLGISIAELFSEESGATYLTDKERILIENFRALDSEQADAVLTLIRVMK